MRNPPPILCYSSHFKQSEHFPFNEKELENWKNDFNEEPRLFYNKAELLKWAENRSVYLLENMGEENLNARDYNDPRCANIKRIIFDYMEGDRRRSHNFSKFDENTRKLFYGFYPAEIRRYLQYLRYNIKNPAEKLDEKFSK